MRKFIWIIAAIPLLFSCPGRAQRDYTGTYVGYSWQDEAKGVSLEEAEQKIETTLTLDSKGRITDAKMSFLVKRKDGTWLTRENPYAEVSVDFRIDPKPAIPQSENQEYKPGASMFTVNTADMMSFYAVAVNQEGTAALLIVEPITRYQFEMKLPTGFDYSMKISEMTIGSGRLVPTIRTSSGGYTKPKSWSDYANTHIFGFYSDTEVMTRRGVLKGLTPDSQVRELLEKLGVTFETGRPRPLDARYGFTGNGGWAGNYQAIAEFLRGKDATKLKSLVDWSNPRYSRSINQDNFFGVDTTSGATRTVQNSVDGIAGATVRMSRESNSYQRALVQAGILEEKDVIKGRF